jgi:hypothetical protein
VGGLSLDGGAAEEAAAFPALRQAVPAQLITVTIWSTLSKKQSQQLRDAESALRHAEIMHAQASEFHDWVYDWFLKRSERGIHAWNVYFRTFLVSDDAFLLVLRARERYTSLSS